MKLQVLLAALWLSRLYCHASRQDESRLRQKRKYAFKEQFYWGMPEFQFPNASARNVALKTGSYIPERNNIWAIQVFEDKIFVSVYRFGVGVASSFNYIPINSATKSPVLIPYPSFDTNYVSEDPAHLTDSLPSQSSIICSGYFRIDKCDRLWVIDAGFINFLGNLRVVTPPAIVIFDLKTDKLLLRYTIPPAFVLPTTFFTNLDVDFKGSGCDDAYAYIVDMFRSIVVFSLKQNRAWRFMHDLLGSVPEDANFHMDGLNFQWNFGTLGITIGERHNDGSKRVYISPLATSKSYYVSNKILQNEGYLANNKYYNDLHLLGDRGKKGQMYGWAYDEKTNVLFDDFFRKRRVGCWNTATPYRNSSFGIVYKTEPSFFPESVSIDAHRNIWIVSNNLPVFLYGSWNPHIKNIRIWKAKVDNAISGTICCRSSKKSHHLRRPH